MKCAICNKTIIGNSITNDWGQTICANHHVEICSSCGRFVSPTDLHADDGRCLCSQCSPSIVSLPQHIEWVAGRVRNILQAHGISDDLSDVNIRLVTPAEMSRLVHSHQINLQQPGLTVTQKSFGLFSSHCNHTIYQFNLLPKVHFAGVLAHELLHVWQNKRGIALPSPETEGFCNLGSYVVYQSIRNDLSAHLIRQMESDPHPVYGDGFRKALGLYKQVGPLFTDVMNQLKECHH